MGIMNWLGIGSDISKPIDAIGNLYTTDKERMEMQAKLIDVSDKPKMAQLHNNRMMIMSGRLFNAGWIALLGWTCGFLILLFYAPQIIITTYVWGNACIENGIVVKFPMSSSDILNLVYLLFGTGAMTTFNNKPQ